MDILPGDLVNGSASPKSSITLSEYQQVRALSLLAGYQERRGYYYPCSDLPTDRLRPYTKGKYLPEEPSSMPEWSDYLRLAFYRTIIIAAGLAGAYHKSTLKATDPETGMSGIIKIMHATNDTQTRGRSSRRKRSIG